MIKLYQKALICIYEIRAFILQLRRLKYKKIVGQKKNMWTLGG